MIEPEGDPASGSSIPHVQVKYDTEAEIRTRFLSAARGFVSCAGAFRPRTGFARLEIIVQLRG